MILIPSWAIRMRADTRAALREAVLPERWRARPSRYAQHMSGGRWTRFSWIEYVMEYVRERVLEGNARIIINAPPRNGKSLGMGHWFPSWYLDLYPERKIIFASYGDRFSIKWGRSVRDHLREHPEAMTKVSQTQGTANDWATTDGGGMRSVGVGGGITGEGGNCIIIDDPHKDWAEALSPTARERVIDWFNGTLYSRLEPGASLIVIQTRWHEGDLTGYLLSEHSDNWEHICLPALAEENDPLGRKPGEALCPERFPVAELDKIKKAISSHMFAGLYQQRPAPLEGGIVKRKWFKRYRPAAELPDKFDEETQVWDLTFKGTGTSFVVGEVWGRSAGKFYLVDQFRDRVDFPGTLRAIAAISVKHPGVARKVVEEAANGNAVISMLKDKIPGIIGKRPQGSKEARLLAVSSYIEAGNVYLPEGPGYEWVEDFIEEVVNFPNAANDDQVDAMTMALAELSQRQSVVNFQLPTAGIRENPWRV